MILKVNKYCCLLTADSPFPYLAHRNAGRHRNVDLNINRMFAVRVTPLKSPQLFLSMESSYRVSDNASLEDMMSRSSDSFSATLWENLLNRQTVRGRGRRMQ
jgi:hypothetical protein